MGAEVLIDKRKSMQIQLQSLLNQISVIIDKERLLKQRKYDSGETFNVFEVLRLQRDEVRLHSSFIAALLDPKGPHGLKTKLLESFLQVMKADDILHDLDTVHVEREMFIGKITKSGEEGGRMDIVLMDKHKNAIVIENKIDARDQPKQLLRYDNYCNKHFKKYRIYYLTKWGVDPSVESCGGKDFDCWTASYSEDILSWLDDCIMISEMIRPVNETIKQYRTNLVEILNIMSENSEKELLYIATKDENIESTLAILENQFIIGKKIRFDFLMKLLVLAEKYGFEGDKDAAEDLADLKKYSYLCLSSPSRSNHFAVYIGDETPSNGFWFSIEATSNRKVSKAALQQLEQQWGTQDPKRKKIDYPYGWDYFWSETGKDGSGQWWKWDDPETLRAMSDGRLLAFIEKEILQKTVEQHLLEELEEDIK